MSSDNIEKCEACKVPLVYVDNDTYFCPGCFKKVKKQDSDGVLVSKYERPSGPPAIACASLATYDTDPEKYARALKNDPDWRAYERSTMSKEDLAKQRMAENIGKRLKGLNVTDVDVKF